MRLKPKIWASLGVLLFAIAIVFWHRAENPVVQQGASANRTAKSPAQYPPKINAANTNVVAKRKSYRITNTTQKIAQLLHNPHALILRNALIDTEVPVALKIPDHLKARGAPGSYLVQADRPLDKDFYAELRNAGATYISYVPNNAALVKATPTQATNLAALADMVAVLPYEPYYKLDSTLLPSAVEQEPQTNALSVTTFPGQRDAALAALTQLGAKLIGEDQSPFGPTLIVNVPEKSLVAVAQMPLAQEIEAFTPRRAMNDLTRVLMGVATNTLIGTPNYLNLTGANVTVNLNDTGVDATHPDLTGRMIGDNPGSLTDGDGHGTHVAGIIAGSGKESSTVSNQVPGSIIPGADFRGKATNATLFVQALDIYYGPFISDSFLQQNASTNLGPTNLISNNSWDYGSTAYDIHSASFDAATRDARPNVDGEQPLLFVFAAGNSGNASDNGIGGNSDTINSPATAKNVITVGASDTPRFITNEVYEGTDSNDVGQVFLGETSSTNLVSAFSSRGNVGIGVEGTYGRFKPDVVAPGAFIVSCRSANYVDPTNELYVTQYPYLGQTVDPGKTNYYPFFLPSDTSGLFVLISSNATSPIPFPTNMFLLADMNYPPMLIGSTNDSYNLMGFNPGDLWFFGVAPPTNQPGPVNYDLNFYLYETNYLGDYFQVLSNLNSVLRPYYRYETGTSMSAGAVSGFLALMQEFLQKNMGMTNPSPALLKAMLINGSRSMSLQYDLNVNTTGANAQGWGLPSLPNCIPPGLTNANASMALVNQSPTNALATGQYQTYTINSSDTNASLTPLRITLVWTDPPGDPAAGVTLVNNLELTVADATGSNIFIGNNFLSGDIFTEVSNPTNLPPGESDNDVQNVYVNQGTPTITSAGDTINNVQNVYINPTNTPIVFPLTVTISGTRINVNAVTTQTNNILQDYALVISSDDTALTSPLTVTSNGIQTNITSLITVASNNTPLLHQRVGANEPNLYNYPLGDTNGALSQWHFFIFTNSVLVVSNATNVAFATFLPPNLSVPRASGSADIDLYVYAPAAPLTDFGTFISTPAGLDQFAEDAIKSVGRTGTESVIFTNSTVPVYYIGVKSEDQQASDFGFYGIAQSNAFSTTSADGNTITATGTSLPLFIPNAVTVQPAIAFAFMVNPNPVLTMIRRATVTLGIQHPSPSDLYGSLQHNGVTSVLNHNTGNPGGFTNTYDDLQEDPNSGDVLSDGPGDLTQFVNQSADGLWLLTESDSAVTQTGYLTAYTVSVDLQQPQTTGFFVTIPAMSWFDDYVDVPNDATNMIIYTLYENSAGTGPIGIFETNEIGDISMTDYGSNNIVAPGGSLTLGTNNPPPGWPPGTPPLAGGYWYYGIYNYGTTPVTLYVQIVIQESLTPNLVQSYTNNAFIPLTTDGHTQSQICIENGQQLVDLQVGLRVADTNLDDLVIHLTSPEGTSVLLFEDRGGTAASNLGMTFITTIGTTNGMTNGMTNSSLATNYVYTVFTEDTNLATTPIKFAPSPYATNLITPEAVLASNSWETVTNGVYTNGAILEGWLVTNNLVTIMTTNGLGIMTNDEVGIVTDPVGEIIGPGTDTNSLGTNYLALTSGRIIQTFGVTNGFTVTNGLPYELVFYAKPLGVTNWWPGNGNPDDIIGTNNGMISNIISDSGTNVIMTPSVTYEVGEVGDAFSFSGGETNEVDFGTNAGNFGTNDFTVDFWINQPVGTTGEYGILEKGSACGLNPYWSVSSDNGPLQLDLPSAVVMATNAVDDGYFHHVAFTRKSENLAMYLDGIEVTNITTAGIDDIVNTNMFRAGQSGCVGTGVEPFLGELDELDLCNRALSPAEVYAIYHAGSLGKYNTNSLLPNFELAIDGVSTNTVVLTNAGGDWELITNTFTATNGQITVEFAGNPMGVLLDDIQLIQLPATNYNNYYLPEEPISPFVGENPLGCWTLDVWDTRDDSPLPVNGQLLSWTLQLTTSSTNATLFVITNGVPFSTTNAPTNQMMYFAIDVPFYATDATNILRNVVGGPLTLYFDQNALPTGGLPGDLTLQPAVTVGSTNTLATFGAPPPLLPGRRYFLGVFNNGAAPASFTLEVDFNGGTNLIIPLTNNIPFTNIVGTNTIGTNGPEYYSFVVPTNAIMVTFQILGNTNGEVDLYARQGMPVPSPVLFDYDSCNAGTNDQFIVVTTNSVPVPLPVSTNILPVPEPSTWYLAAYNPTGVTNDTYRIIATVLTNGELTIIPLTNGVPYTNIFTPPGYPTNLMYSFTITNNPSGVIFTVTNLTNTGVELLADINGFPTPQAPYYGSLNPGSNSQYIEITPNANLPTLNGVWYLAVPNLSLTNVTYQIEATTNIPLPTNFPITWTGAINDKWDILSTSNWIITGSSPPTNWIYQNGAVVTFDNTGIITTVDVSEDVSPASITVSSSTYDYTFIGAGDITSTPLTVNGGTQLTIDNSGPNNFSSILIDNGSTLQVGNNDANGSIGPNAVDTGTSFGQQLVFDRSDNIIVPNLIFDGGDLVQEGMGHLILAGVNTYTGNTTVAAGTLLPSNTNALGSGGLVTIASGATFDLGDLPVPYAPASSLFDGKQFRITGFGIGGIGAIVNNGVNQQRAGLEQIEVKNGNASIGGTTRWDIRNGLDEISLDDFTLIKIGANLIDLFDTTIEGGGNNGNIIINQGILSFEDAPTFVSVSNIMVNSGGLLGEILITSNSFTCSIVLDGGGNTNMSGGGVTYLDAPIALSNNAWFGNGAGTELFNGVISGTGSLTNLGNGINLLSATNTYTGATYVAQGTLGLTNTGSITNSSNIVVYPLATLDASERFDSTLTLVSNQSLLVNGTVVGTNVVALAGSSVAGAGTVISNFMLNPGATLSPGPAPGMIGTFTVLGNAALGGTTYMKINPLFSPAQSNDVIAAYSIGFGGTLVVTNLGPTNAFVVGNSFRLFNSLSSVGAFANLILPPLPSGLAWENSFLTNGGTITVVAGTQPSFASVDAISLSGTNVVLSGTNGTPGGEFFVLGSTNLLIPLSNWMVLSTDYFDSFGDFSVTNGIPTNETLFYMLESQ